MAVLNGELYFSYSYNDGYVRKINLTTGIITTIAGNGQGYSGDGGPAVNAT